MLCLHRVLIFIVAGTCKKALPDSSSMQSQVLLLKLIKDHATTDMHILDGTGPRHGQVPTNSTSLDARELFWGEEEEELELEASELEL